MKNIFNEVVMQADLDGDGIIDSIVTGVDFNGDGIIDASEIIEVQQIPSWDFYSNDHGSESVGAGEGVSAGYEQFSPEETDMEQVIGTPAADEQCWEYQGESGPCAIYAQVMAYEGMTGADIDPREMIEIATEQGWYNNGTAMEDMDKILNYLGAETEKGYDGSMEDLQECLENDGRVVVAVDGDEIWYGNDEIYAPNNPNHAVEVIGIDYSGEEPMVIINDSGTIDGHAIMVPQSQFEDAWEDSGCFYVEAYV